MDANLLMLIEKFLQKRRESDGGGWSPVTGEDWEDLHNIIDLLIEAKWDPDCDNDLPIEFFLINRNTHHRMSYAPVPYSSRIRELEGRQAIQGKLDVHHAVTLNFNLAQSDLDHYLRGHEDDLREEKKRAPKSPPPEEHCQADKCPECGRQSVVPASGGGVKCIADDCAYWFCY